jgi:hypothetical protein
MRRRTSRFTKTSLLGALAVLLLACTSGSGGSGPLGDPGGSDPSDGYPKVQVSANLTKGDGGTCPNIPNATLQARNGQCLFNGATSGGNALGAPCQSADDCTGICCFCPSGSVEQSYATKAACINKTCANPQAACDVLACQGACSR